MKFRAPTESDCQWFFTATSYYPGSQFTGIVAYEGEEVLGMVGLDYWTPRSVQMHVAVDNARCTIPLWREVVDYLKQHGRRLIYAVTPSSNDRSLNLQRVLGFKETHRLNDAWSDGVDMVITEFRIHEHESTKASRVRVTPAPVRELSNSG